MRIIGGKNRKRNITPPSRLKLRPTTDFAKESLFNILANHFDFEGLEVLDLFSGSGAISYEFCSRGAARAVSVEMNAANQRFIEGVARELEYDQMRSIKADVFSYLRTVKDSFDIVFADPPYDMRGVDKLPDLILGKPLLKPEGQLIIEHSKDHDFSTHPNFLEVRHYGSVFFSFFLVETVVSKTEGND